ncbi:hypothetical protein Taro_020117 [Colocasia esculenta]|uniref:Uncharacterized protein n=1 Tax=Colocasia esculenta TaxID=4460 RepID=A0A843UVK5_COLES|nr:hypothetical protein [Colocasia esculenta]
MTMSVRVLARLPRPMRGRWRIAMQRALPSQTWIWRSGSMHREGRVYGFGDSLDTTPVLSSYASSVAPQAYASSYDDDDGGILFRKQDDESEEDPQEEKTQNEDLQDPLPLVQDQFPQSSSLLRPPIPHGSQGETSCFPPPSPLSISWRGLRAPVERRSKHRDDRLSKLIVPPNLKLVKVLNTFTKFVQPRYVDFVSLENMQCFRNPKRSMPYACPITSLLLFIGIHILKGELVDLKSRSSFDLTATHRMGYKLVDGKVSRDLKGKEKDVEEEDFEDEESGDEDSHAEPMDAQGDDDNDVEDQLNARFDHVDTRMDALADTHVQIQHRLTRLSTEFHEFRHPPAPGNDDV